MSSGGGGGNMMLQGALARGAGRGRLHMWLEELPPPPPLLFNKPAHVAPEKVEVWGQLKEGEPFTALVPTPPLTEEDIAKRIRAMRLGQSNKPTPAPGQSAQKPANPDAVASTSSAKQGQLYFSQLSTPLEGAAASGATGGSSSAKLISNLRPSGKMWLLQTGYRRHLPVSIFEEDWEPCYYFPEFEEKYCLYEDRGLVVANDEFPSFRKALLLLHTKSRNGFVFEITVPNLAINSKRSPRLSVKRVPVTLDPSGLIYSAKTAVYFVCQMTDIVFLVPQLCLEPPEDPLIHWDAGELPMRLRIHNLLGLDMRFRSDPSMFEQHVINTKFAINDDDPDEEPYFKFNPMTFFESDDDFSAFGDDDAQINSDEEEQYQYYREL